MCLGVPMQVISAKEHVALCQHGDRIEEVSLALIGDVEEGQDVLVYLGSAVRVLGRKEAKHIADALEAVSRAASGESFEHLIADLVDREPQLPPHLKPSTHSKTQGDPE